MSRRSGSVVKIIIYVAVGVLGLYGFYLYSDLQGRLQQTEKELSKYRSQHESVSAQLQVVFEHKSRLERSLEQVKTAHKQEKEEIEAKKYEADQKHAKELQELQNKFDSTNQQLRLLQGQHEDLQSQYQRQQSERTKQEEDHKQLTEQHNQEFQQLRQEKDLEIAQLKDQIADLKREKERIQLALSAGNQQQNNLQQQQGQQQQQQQQQPGNVLQGINSFQLNTNQQQQQQQLGLNQQQQPANLNPQQQHYQPEQGFNQQQQVFNQQGQGFNQQQGLNQQQQQVPVFNPNPIFNPQQPGINQQPGQAAQQQQHQGALQFDSNQANAFFNQQRLGGMDVAMGQVTKPAPQAQGVGQGQGLGQGQGQINLNMGQLGGEKKDVEVREQVLPPKWKQEKDLEPKVGKPKSSSPGQDKEEEPHKPVLKAPGQIPPRKPAGEDLDIPHKQDSDNQDKPKETQGQAGQGVDFPGQVAPPGGGHQDKTKESNQGNEDNILAAPAGQGDNKIDSDLSLKHQDKIGREPLPKPVLPVPNEDSQLKNLNEEAKNEAKKEGPVHQLLEPPQRPYVDSPKEAPAGQMDVPGGHEGDDGEKNDKKDILHNVPPDQFVDLHDQQDQGHDIDGQKNVEHHDHEDVDPDQRDYPDKLGNEDGGKEDDDN